MGRRNRPFYRICVFDARTRRDGRSIEDIGTYDVMASDKDKVYSLKVDRLKYWLSVGAKPSETVASIIKKLDIQ
jgi:small subunit ribosomal protein S16